MTYTRPHMWSFVPNEAGTGTVGVCSRCGCGENEMPPGGCPAPAYAPTFISLFAGVGGFDLGLERAGWRCLAQVEIDKHARKVLDQRWPDVPKHGDVTTYTYEGTQDVDAVVGGFPCQDVSVAGRRAGLAGARSGLFWHAIRIVEEVRPRWVVLENVPGLLNSHQGRDFAVVLGALADAGFPHVEWRVLDSQFFGVPQRRRRVFIVGRAGAPAALPVLAEPEGRGGNTGAGDATWPPPPAGARRGAASGRGVVNALDTQQGGGRRQHGPSRAPRGDVMATLNSGGNTGGFRTEPGEHLVVEPACPLCRGFEPHYCKRHAAENLAMCVNCGDDDGPYRVCLDCLEQLT